MEEPSHCSLEVAGFTGSLSPSCGRYHENENSASAQDPKEPQLREPGSHYKGKYFKSVKIFHPHNGALKFLPVMWSCASISLFLLTQDSCSSSSTHPTVQTCTIPYGSHYHGYFNLNSLTWNKLRSQFPLLVTLQVWLVSQWLPYWTAQNITRHW